MSAAALTRGAEPLAVFECREITGREWPRTLVTYALTRDDYQPPAEARAGLPDTASPGWVKLKAPLKTDAVKLVDAAGQEQPCQFWRVEKDADGSVKSARVSFFASLAPGGQYRYELVVGKPAAGAPPKVSTGGGFVTLDSGAVAIRLPGGKKEFKKPLVFPADHAAAMKNLGNLEKAGLAFGPIAGVRLADGQWVGGSYFTTESIEAVRFREGYRKDPPDAATAAAALAAAPKMAGYATQVTEQGPLFAEARVRFAFDGGGYYQLTARVLANDPAVRIDEVMDLGGNCPPDHPLYVAMLLGSGWAKDGWRPDAAFMMTTRRKTKCEPLEEALKQHGFASRYASAAVDYTQDAALVTEIVPHDPWSDRAHYVGLVDAAKLRADKAAPFLGIIPMHAGSWRAAHWVFPPKNPNLFEQLLSWKDGAVEMQWTIRAQPHSQNLLHTGEFDPDFGQTGVRRLWCLVAGPFQYHDTLHPLRANEGYINLDNYKDWTLAWSDDTRAGAALPLGAKDREESGALRQFHAALLGDDREYPWFSHYRQSEGTAWTVKAREVLADASVPPARRGQLRAQVAAFACLMAEPDVNTRASGTHQGNPNMPVNRFFAAPFAAAVIPDHPMAKTWMDMAAAYVRYKGGVNTAPGGAWAELISYYAASAPTLVHGALVAQETGRLDNGTRTLVTGPVDFVLRLLAPPDPRFGGMRVVPGFGHEGALAFNVWTPAAAIWKDKDPARAALYAWAWKQQGEPGESQHCNGFSLMTEPLGRDLAGKADPVAIRKDLVSVWLPGFGAILRAHAGEPGETYFGLRQGYLASHSDANQGDFVIYAKGAPLTAMSNFGYAMRQYDEYKKVYAEFGWHSRVRFGKQADDGGWPGGGPVSGIDRHFFSDSADYLRAVGDYSPTFLRPEDPIARDLSAPEALRWTRQVLFFKGKRAGGPDTFVFRDSFRNLAKGGRENLPPTWWYQRTLGRKDLVKPSPTGFDYASPWGPKMNVRFLQPAEVKIESREALAQGPMYGWLAKGWQAAGSPVVKKEHETAATIEETLTISAAGPIAAGQDVLVAICPLAKDEVAPKVESLGDGAARITTAEGTDYVFANPDGLALKRGDVAFDGVAGAVRVYADEVHLIVAEGAGTVSYKGCTLKAGQPATKVVPMTDVARGGTFEVPAEKVGIAFALDEKAGAIEEVAPGVRRQKRASGMAWEFRADRPLRFERDGIIFVGTRGGLVTDGEAGTVRLVMVEGERIACQGREAKECRGPYDLTFHKDKVVAVAEGPARFLIVTQPEGIVQMPCVNIGGVRYAPGTYDRWMIVPLLGGQFEFTLENLPQPPVLRSWQEW
jgi:hypothetical protein